jgi:hypothetical protein
MEIRVGTFVRRGIEEDFRSDLQSFVLEALRTYAARGCAPKFPRFLADLPSGADAPPLALPVDPELTALLAAEGMRQLASVEAIAGHALFVRLAELDRAASDPDE